MHKTDTRDDTVAKNSICQDNRLLSKCQCSALFLVKNKRIFLYGTKVSRKGLPILTGKVGGQCRSNYSNNLNFKPFRIKDLKISQHVNEIFY